MESRVAARSAGSPPWFTVTRGGESDRLGSGSWDGFASYRRPQKPQRRRFGQGSVLATALDTGGACLLKRSRRFESCRGHSCDVHDFAELPVGTLWSLWLTTFHPTWCSADPTARIVGTLRPCHSRRSSDVTEPR